MPPRGSEGLDFTPILTHYFFLCTSVFAIAAWFIAFISQAFVEAHFSAGTLWFAIFLQLFLILGILYTLATDAVSLHRFQISVFGAVAIAFSVEGVQFNGPSPAHKAMSTGWLILSMVNILWVLYFTSEEESLIFHILNSMGNGGLTPPSRRRRTRTQSSMQHMGGGNGYAGPYATGGGIGSQDVPYDTKVGSGYGGTALRSQNSFVGSMDGTSKSITAGTAGPGSINNIPSANVGSAGGGDNGPHSPLMAGVGAGGSHGTNSTVEPQAPPADSFAYKARALYGYTANPDDPNEISFAKGEVLDIIDKNGKWWQAKKADGSVGIAPSNYLSLI
ncbi:hypothetical protein AGABI2DRAFT_197139 [Agaricus bisporus var. bisporus H97]|uniref:hypothetical protein n=1 Tax=Agaricus bisporus var. bisporus (strain H97 / ATCC MYA-4626 / FGSC 10389) TaxID=936046 RepID=UPI00029F7055|nr:hypothetical protein AGABI2DRAFT_197139 [Agaricus bisporus var. bisporus H97]EKV51273.1 hypothetical protein AGABI2DRAFT_197139 [Agaricus bisporus var. bisporus H97]